VLQKEDTDWVKKCMEYEVECFLSYYLTGVFPDKGP